MDGKSKWQEPISRSIQLPYIPVTAFSLTHLFLDGISGEGDSRGSVMTNHKKLIWRHYVAGLELPFFHKRKGILKIDQSPKIPWHRLSMGVVCSYSSVPGSEHFACQDSGLSHIHKLIVSASEKILNNISVAVWGQLRGCPCKNRPLDFRPKTEFLQIFRVRQLVHVINKNGNNLAVNAICQYFWRQFQRTVQNRLNRSVSSQI